MTIKEPRFMQDLHKIRERLSRRYRRMSKEQLLRELTTSKTLRERRKAA